MRVVKQGQACRIVLFKLLALISIEKLHDSLSQHLAVHGRRTP